MLTHGREDRQVNIRESKVKSKKSSGFYSAQSFFDGFTNNALGVVGFVAEGIKEEVGGSSRVPCLTHV